MRRILWFRRDLRVDDNPLLSFAGEVFPIFIFDTNILTKLNSEDKRVGMIYDFVLNLKKDLRSMGLDLKIYYGDPIDVFNSLNLSYFDEVVASGDYDSYSKERDRKVSHLIDFKYVDDTYIFKPNDIVKNDGSPYLVFSYFYKRALQHLDNKDLKRYLPVKQTLYKENYELTITLESLGFCRHKCHSYDVNEKIHKFKKKLHVYEEKRDYMIEEGTSDLSIGLRFGLISIRTLYNLFYKDRYSRHFIRQLFFRDFYAYLLFHFPYLEKKNYKGMFNGVRDIKKFELFAQANTGVPIVDAGIKELLSSGRMHNRVRMIVASFFVKDLLLPWQDGESFFAKHLLDYDAASNILSWQWSSGTGIDPQPYFRVFNPYLQSKKFDENALYIKKHIPQLKNIEAKYLHNEEYLLNHSIEDYPKPMLIHSEAAKIAKDSFKK